MTGSREKLNSKITIGIQALAVLFERKNNVTNIQ
jgi:hypothetical protein